MIHFVFSFIALLISSFLFVWSMHEFVGWKNQLFLLFIALGSMGIFFSCFSVFSFFQQKPFPEEKQDENLTSTPPLWWLSALVFSLAFIIGITLVLFDRNKQNIIPEIAKTEKQNTSGKVVYWSGNEIISLEWENTTPPNPLNEGEKHGSQELPNAQNQIRTTNIVISTSVSPEKQNTKRQPTQRNIQQRQYLSDGTPIPHQGERIFLKLPNTN